MSVAVMWGNPSLAMSMGSWELPVPSIKMRASFWTCGFSSS